MSINFGHQPVKWSALATRVGLDRSAFDNKSVSFEEHCKLEHNMWHYLFFIILVKVKDPTEFTGPESYVCSMIQVDNAVSCYVCFSGITWAV